MLRVKQSLAGLSELLSQCLLLYIFGCIIVRELVELILLHPEALVLELVAVRDSVFEVLDDDLDLQLLAL